MRRRDVLAATAGAIAAPALAGGIAWAAIPGDGGVIQGCYDSRITEAGRGRAGSRPLPGGVAAALNASRKETR